MSQAPIFPVHSLNTEVDATTDGADEGEGRFTTRRRRWSQDLVVHEPPFPLPVGSIASVLAITMLNFVVFMAANGLPWLGLAISLMSGVGFCVTCRCYAAQRLKAVAARRTQR